MSQIEIHQCQCPECQIGTSSPIQADHQRTNLLMSRLDEQQRRWYAAVAAEQLGHGGTKRIAQITGLNVNTIRRGRREMAQGLRERPRARQRVAGGGRKAVEKKQPT
jgi:hypothetical protein